jgi:aldehyde dehydrogenase (NAD+)
MSSLKEAQRIKAFVLKVLKRLWRVRKDNMRTINFTPDLRFTGKNYINGRFTKRGGSKKLTFASENPSTGNSMGIFPKTEPEYIQKTVTSAKVAFKSWKKISRVQRADYFYRLCKIIERRREELSMIISLETGKTYNESIAEVNEALHMSMYAFGSGRLPHGEALASEIAEKDSYILRKPKGVIAIISPFNFPAAIGAFWCAAPAIVEGNTVILKPSEDAPMTGQFCAEMYHEAGFPKGVFNMIHGCGGTGAALVKYNVDHVCFTGSAAVGKHIRKECARSWHKTASCELGSKSACIVFDDANIDLAIEACFASAFKLSGQRCVSSGRMIVQRGIYNKFVERFLKECEKIKVGNPLKTVASTCGTPAAIGWEKLVPDETITYGPLINEDGMSKVIHYNELVVEDPKAEVLLMGEKLNGKGNFITPTVYKSAWRKEASFLREEVFGPHVAIIPFETPEDGIRIYNDTEYGLAVGVITEDFHKARACRDQCDAGMIYWNGGSIAAESHLSFGGVKKSGNGYPSAARTVRAVTHEISWTVNHGDGLSFPQGMK